MLSVTLKQVRGWARSAGAGTKPWRRKRRLTGVIVAIGLGVAFLAGALTLGDTLNANFTQLFSTATSGISVVVRSATAVDTGADAARPPIPAALAATVRRVPGVAAAAPSITGAAELLGSGGKAIGGLGPPRSAGNWISNPALTPYRLAAGRAPQGLHEVVIDKGAAATGKLAIGSVTTVLTPAPVRVRVVGLATFGTAASFGGAPYTAFSLAGAQRYLTTKPGRVSAIEVSAAPGVSPATLVSRLNRVLPRGVRAISGAELTQQSLSDVSSEFLSALRIFLVIFAGIALLVAAFSIASTFGILVAQRTREAALLRTVGATRRQVRTGVLAEALTVGAAGSGLGLLGGLGIAELLKGLFDSFGFALPASGLVVSPASVIVSLVAGIAVTVGVSVIPAVRASRAAPLEALHESAAEAEIRPWRRAVTGLVLVAAGLAAVLAGLTGSGNGVLTAVGLGAVVITAGFVALGPVVARPVIGALGRPVAAWRGVTGTLAERSARRNPRRTAAAATALAIGVAVVTLFTVYAASLRAADINGVSGAFTGDIAISPGGFGGGGSGGGGLSPALAKAVAKVPGVRTVSGLATGQAVVDGTPAGVTAVVPATVGQVLDLHPVAGSVGRLGPRRIAVSQVQASDHGWQVGSRVSLVLPDGTRASVTVAAVYTSRNLVGDTVLPLSLWAPHALQLTASEIFVKLAPGTSVATAQAAITRIAAGYGRPTVADHAAFVASAGKPVSTFLNLVYVLLVLAIVIAVFGIANTLSLTVYERTREIGLLRAVGETRAQTRSMVRLESVLVSVFGTVGGLCLGTFLGWALAEAGAAAEGLAQFTVPGSQLVIILILGVAAGVVAASRPARRATRLPVLAAIATE
jgi:putative ABC transport system permease protein